ncbi:MAG: DUF3500 domain-containing protein, partial [Planctomycetota bacterium]
MQEARAGCTSCGRTDQKLTTGTIGSTRGIGAVGRSHGDARTGLPLREMNDTQRTAAMGLMAAILSESGFRRAVDIMAYEAILLE